MLLCSLFRRQTREAPVAGELRASPDRIREACLRTGFFLIDPDGSESTDTAVAQAEAFFSLDDNDPRKQRVKRGDADFGWMPTYSEPAYQPGTVSRLESFDCGVSNVNPVLTTCSAADSAKVFSVSDDQDSEILSDYCSLALDQRLDCAPVMGADRLVVPVRRRWARAQR